MAKEYLQIRMVGEGVEPDTVKASDLALFITEVEKALQDAVRSATGNELPDSALVSLERFT